MPAKKKSTKGKKPKAKKEKKTGKKDAKAGKDSEVEAVKANAALLELKLKVTEKCVSNYEEHSYKVTCANEQLINQLYQTEGESLDMTAYWEKQLASKEEKIAAVEECLRNEQLLAVEEKTVLAQDLNRIQEKMKEKDAWEAQLEKELINAQVDMDLAEKEHMEHIRQLEEQHNQQIVSLAKEAAERSKANIARLKQEHREEITQLNRTLQAAFTERDWLNETLKNTTTDMEDLKGLANSLIEKNKLLEMDKEMLQTELKETTIQLNKKKKKISELKAKVAFLERTLTLAENKLERQEEENNSSQIAVQSSQIEIDKLQHVIDMREKEIQKVKNLGSIIIKKRTDLELFFHEALDHVRQEIAANKIQERKEALQDYQFKFREALSGRTKFPPICAFRQQPYNYIYPDVGTTSRWAHLKGSEIQISDLTWEQKEDVLCLLFAKMNDQRERKICRHLAICDSFVDQTNLNDTNDVD